MATASVVGLACLVVSFGATIMSMVRARKLQTKVARSAAVVAVLLLLIHPTVWLGVSSGDCGQVLLIAGPVMASIHLMIAGFLMLKKSAAASH